MSALIASVIFSAIGLGVFIYGKRQNEAKPMLLGFALMAFPYVLPYIIPGAVWLWVVGCLLTAALFSNR